MAVLKSSLITLLTILVFLNLFAESFVYCHEHNERNRRDTLTDSKNLGKDKTPKKATFEKKSDLKNKSSKSDQLISVFNETLLDSDLYPNDLNNRTDLNVTYINDNEFNNEFNNASINNDTINHRYFNSTLITNPKDAMALWIDIDSLPKHQTFVHEVLSDSHRRAASINLPFNFPFYGNLVNKTTIATGGFLFMGEFVHAWLAATQYIAPLMANFDTRNSSDSMIRYGYNSSQFVVQWNRVRLQENTSLEFTFQCILYINGDVAFVYKDIPIPIADIHDNNHPVKIGMSDAYFINRHQLFVRRKAIYEYHKVDILTTHDNSTILNQTAIFFKALPTCFSIKTCDGCMSANINFECVWCPQVQRCSDGYDRQRQEWINKHCDMRHVQSVNECAAFAKGNTTIASSTESPVTTNPSISSTLHPTIISSDHSIDLQHHEKKLSELEYNTQEQRAGNNQNKNTKAHGIAMAVFFLVAIIGGIGLWVFYAYRNPTSSSGQFLIQWRPTSWRLNSLETRYTAASIHM